MKSNIKSIAALIATSAAFAAINYTIIHNPIVFVISFILIAHELGHYFAAFANGAKADVPYIIPLPFIGIGITRIKNFKQLSAKVRKSILLSGPITGVFTALIIFFYLLLNPIISPLAVLIVALFEVIFNYLGSDGKKYRQIKREELSCIF
jgi:hypothetical protein